MVIGIIGLLTSIVLVNVRGSKDQAKDANIQSTMHQIRNAAEISYIQNNESYTDVCDEADETMNDAGEFGYLEEAIVRDNGGYAVKCFESANKKDFAVSSPLVSRSGKYWCVESAGLSIELDGEITGATCQ